MSALDNAIEDQATNLAAYSHGTTQGGQPAVREHSQEWFELRAQTLALAYMNRVRTLELASDPAACERLYRTCLAVFKQAVPPPAEAPVRERLPDGSLPSGSIQ